MRFREECWSSGVEQDEVSSCGLVEPPTVYFFPKALGQIDFLMNKFPSTEWAADLLGKRGEKDFYVESLYVFKQVVTATSVKREEEKEGAIGVIHSHHHMGSFFSGTDDAYPNMNHDLSGVCSREPSGFLPFTMKFTARVKTPCGKVVRFNDIPVRLFLPSEVVQTEGKIKEHRMSYLWDDHFLDRYPLY